MEKLSRTKIKGLATLVVACAVGTGAGLSTMVVNAASTGAASSTPTSTPSLPRAHVALDRSGRKQVGIASFYAKRYSGKTMADGTPMHLYSNNAASLTLPLGTTARVTNLETGRSATVTIRDRGPYVDGRIVDLSPGTAQSIGIDKKKGLAKVEVTPLSVPLADGTVWVNSATVARN